MFKINMNKAKVGQKNVLGRGLDALIPEKNGKETRVYVD